MLLVNNLELWHLLVAGLIILLGYPIHELLHVLPLVLAGQKYAVNVYPRNFFSFRRFVEIEGQQRAPRPVVVASALAPGILWAPAVVVWMYLLCWCSGPVLASDLLVVGAWFVIFLPSPVDWKQAYRAVTQ